jgi:hypothetical protein
MGFSALFLLQSFTRNRKFARRNGGDREIPNSTAGRHSATISCGKKTEICGKPRESLWKICGISGEKSAKR